VSEHRAADGAHFSAAPAFTDVGEFAAAALAVRLVRDARTERSNRPESRVSCSQVDCQVGPWPPSLHQPD
jgi:hypothetical protein